MDGWMYPASLVLLAILAFIFNQSNNTKMALLMILFGAYIIYSNESGDSATDWKNEMVESIDKSVGNYNEERGISGYNPKKTEEKVK